MTNNNYRVQALDPRWIRRADKDVVISKDGIITIVK